MGLYRNRRGALEGLPLYLIILVVVAAVVIVILLGWLSTLNKSSLNHTDYVVFGSFTSVDSSDASFSPTNVQGECLVNVPASGTVTSTPAITVTAYDQNSKPLGGVIVTLETGASVLNITGSPGGSQTTNSNGQATFTTLQFTMESGQDTGIITLSFSYSGGIASGQSTTDIAVSSPSGQSC